jgi:hypothetical protein
MSSHYAECLNKACANGVKITPTICRMCRQKRRREAPECEMPNVYPLVDH